MIAKKRISPIKLFTFIGNILVPIYAVIMCLIYRPTWSGGLFAFFISAMIVERGWETFKTTKEHRRDELHGDWTLVVVTATYLLLFFLLITEFYAYKRDLNIYVTIGGSALLIASFRMRFWGMAALGKQWAVHAVGAQKIKKVRLIKLGPYKYVRHPIYSGIILEELSYPIIANAFYSVAFALIVCVPLVIIRAFVEEKSSIRRFGNSYAEYKKEVGMVFPTHLFRRR